jgi:hypothetical protein
MNKQLLTISTKEITRLKVMQRQKAGCQLGCKERLHFVFWNMDHPVNFTSAAVNTFAAFW